MNKKNLSNSLTTCTISPESTRYFTIHFNDRSIRENYGNILHIYRVNKRTNETKYVNRIGYGQFIGFSYDYMKKMNNKEIFFVTGSILTASDFITPIFIIDYDRLNINKYHFNEENLFFNENNRKNERIFKKYIKAYKGHSFISGNRQISFISRELIRYNTILEDKSLDIFRYIYLFNKIDLLFNKRIFTGTNYDMICNVMLTYEIKYMSSKNEKISKKLINNIKISHFNKEFERYYKTLWKLAPQEIINILMNHKITNFKEYVYNYS